VLAVPVTSSTTAPALKTSGSGICHVTLTFFDGQSNTVKQTDKRINPGQSTFLSLSTDDYRSGGRQLFYGEVQLDSDSNSSCRLSNSLQIDNSYGGTEVLIPVGPGLNAAPFS